MELFSINLEHFRNIETANLSFSSKRIFFIGSNGQGKTNLLEAIGLCSSLRSFRKTGTDGLVMDGKDESRLFYQFKGETVETTEILFSFRLKGPKSLEVDGEKVKRFADYLGCFPSVCLSSRDFRLVRDGPSERRKWLDMLLSSSSPEYFEALQSFHRSLKERNSLLKQNGSDKELDAFERILIPAASKVMQLRKVAFPKLSNFLKNYYSSLTGGIETATLLYRPDLVICNEDEFSQKLVSDRFRDRQFGSTRRGPHRDDFELNIEGRDARTFASEGQQKGLVLGLRLAEFDYLREATSRVPVVLADDVLGELDVERKENFKKLLPDDAQVFATGTSFPEGNDRQAWETFEVKNGAFFKAVPTS